MMKIPLMCGECHSRDLKVTHSCGAWFYKCKNKKCGAVGKLTPEAVLDYQHYRKTKNKL